MPLVPLPFALGKVVPEYCNLVVLKTHMYLLNLSIFGLCKAFWYTGSAFIIIIVVVVVKIT